MLTLNIELKSKPDFSKVLAEIPIALTRMLDEAASDTRRVMETEAPYRKGGLTKSIRIEKPNNFTRVVAVKAPYGSAVETGTKNYTSLPNLSNIAAYYGLNYGDKTQRNLVLAIAKHIRDEGTPTNPFASRTFQWLLSQIDRMAVPFFDRIKASFMTTVK